jgi:uncharacterized protein HemY
LHKTLKYLNGLEQLGKILIISGIILVIAGLIVYFAGDKLGWLGHLPGDVRIEKENIKIYFPITTMIILSVLISLIIFIIRKLFQ